MRFLQAVPKLQKSHHANRECLHLSIRTNWGKCHMRDDRGFSKMNGVCDCTKAFMMRITARMMALPLSKAAKSRTEKGDVSATPHGSSFVRMMHVLSLATVKLVQGAASIELANSPRLIRLHRRPHTRRLVMSWVLPWMMSMS